MGDVQGRESKDTLVVGWGIVVWCGLVWPCIVWSGLVWSGLVWSVCDCGCGCVVLWLCSGANEAVDCVRSRLSSCACCVLPRRTVLRGISWRMARLTVTRLMTDEADD